MEKLKEGVATSKGRDKESPNETEPQKEGDKSQQSVEHDNKSEKSGAGDVKNSAVSNTSNNKSLDGPAPAGPSAASAETRSIKPQKAQTNEAHQTPSTNRDGSPAAKSPGGPEQQQYQR